MKSKNKKIKLYGKYKLLFTAIVIVHILTLLLLFIADRVLKSDAAESNFVLAIMYASIAVNLIRFGILLIIIDAIILAFIAILDRSISNKTRIGLGIFSVLILSGLYFGYTALIDNREREDDSYDQAYSMHKEDISLDKARYFIENCQVSHLSTQLVYGSSSNPEQKYDYQTVLKIKDKYLNDVELKWELDSYHLPLKYYKELVAVAEENQNTCGKLSTVDNHYLDNRPNISKWVQENDVRQLLEQCVKNNHYYQFGYDISAEAKKDYNSATGQETGFLIVEEPIGDWTRTWVWIDDSVTNKITNQQTLEYQERCKEQSGKFFSISRAKKYYIKF